MQNEGYERDGIHYSVIVHETGGGYRATWTCESCQRSGGSKDAYKSEAEAVGRCEATLFVDHHIPVHILPKSSWQSSIADHR